MNHESHIDDLLLEWDEARANGRELTAEELCSDYPALVDEVRQGIAELKSTDWMFESESDEEMVPSLATTTKVRSSKPRASRSRISCAMGRSMSFFIFATVVCPFSCVSQLRNGTYSDVTSIKRAPASTSRRARSNTRR